VFIVNQWLSGNNIKGMVLTKSNRMSDKNVAVNIKNNKAWTTEPDRLNFLANESQPSAQCNQAKNIIPI